MYFSCLVCQLLCFGILIFNFTTIFYNVFLGPFIVQKAIHICAIFNSYLIFRHYIGMKMGVRIARGKIHCMSAIFYAFTEMPLHIFCHLYYYHYWIFLCCFLHVFCWGKGFYVLKIHSEIGHNITSRTLTYTGEWISYQNIK